jgi:hypothetical protein
VYSEEIDLVDSLDACAALGKQEMTPNHDFDKNSFDFGAGFH